MAKLVFGMNQSLDGYVDHMAFGPSPTLFRHFIEEAQGQAGSVYGRQMYEVMRYWDDDHPEWGAEERAFAGGVAETTEMGGLALVENRARLTLRQSVASLVRAHTELTLGSARAALASRRAFR
jgi:hypothetical protein